MDVLRKHIAVLGMLFLLLNPIPIQAASLSLPEVRQEFEAAIEKGEKQAAVTVSANFTLEQILKQLSKAAETQQLLYTGDCTCQKQMLGDQVQYTIGFTDTSFIKVKRLDSPAAAGKAALKALKSSDYTTKFYSDTSYYPIFLLMLQQHPEYNYDTMIWKNENGTYGYHRSRELTDMEQDNKMRFADKKAAAIVKKKLKQNMTDLQKLKVLHNYLLKSCKYNYNLEEIDGYEDELTAYGALVKKKAVCQGYTAAFNLLAHKAGIDSIAVCGKVSTGSHTWNYVKVSRQYLHIDCTWDKTLQTGTKLRYDYFAIPGEIIAQNHTWDEQKFTPEHVSYCKYLR